MTDPSTALPDLDFRLLNAYQHRFPTDRRPFAVIASELGCDETVVIDKLLHLQEGGLISRIGPVFRPNAIGVSTLAALAVPVDRLEAVAARVSAHAEINHNYEREHRYNLWFVATASSQARLQDVLHKIERESGCGPVLVLPLVEAYHIDLGFDLQKGSSRRTQGSMARCGDRPHAMRCEPLTETELELVSALQEGIPLTHAPYATLGLPEEQAISIINRWIAQGVIKRFGIVVKHHELGYRANAMVVWDVPDSAVGEAGQRIAASGTVTLCYRRPRRLPDWPYNLFCMVHGRDRDDVALQIEAISQSCGLADMRKDVLFSRRRFKQCGARYAPAREALDGRN